MTYPLPDHLAAVRHEIRLTLGVALLALVACILFVLAAFGVDFTAVNIVALGLAFLAAHFVVPVALPGRRAG